MLDPLHTLRSFTVRSVYFASNIFVVFGSFYLAIHDAFAGENLCICDGWVQVIQYFRRDFSPFVAVKTTGHLYFGFSFLNGMIFVLTGAAKLMESSKYNVPFSSGWIGGQALFVCAREKFSSP